MNKRIALLLTLIFLTQFAWAQVIPRGESFNLDGLRVKIIRQISEGAYAKVYKAETVIDGVTHTIAVKPFFSSRYSLETLNEIENNYLQIRELSKSKHELIPILGLGTTQITALDDLEFDEKEHSRKRRNDKVTALVVLLEFADRDLSLPAIRTDVSTTDLTMRLKIVEKLILAGESAIQNLATVGAIHGDLKPANFLLFSDGQIRLADFDHMTSRNNFKAEASLSVTLPIEVSRSTGTPGFHPPEFLNGQAYLATSDRYALAMTALKLLAGKTLHEFIGNIDPYKSLNETDHSIALKLASEHLAKLKKTSLLENEHTQQIDSISQFIIQNLSYSANLRIHKFNLDQKTKMCSKLF